MIPNHPWIGRYVTIDSTAYRIDAVTDLHLHLSTPTHIRAVLLLGCESIPLCPEPPAQPTPAQPDSPAWAYIARRLGDAESVRIPARDIASAVVGADPTPVQIRQIMAPLRAHPIHPGGSIALAFTSGPPVFVIATKS